ncbi:MAG: nucleotidyltransferase domain-containing protein [Syntrophomonadaceae bacterium]|nr:nucleotidyltransferase domain-containing protein [Syntrophomonadaceae bacterium]
MAKRYFKSEELCVQVEHRAINDLKKKIEISLRGREDIAAVYLFGSYGTEYQNKYSDIDLGIIFMPEVKVDLKEELQLEADLSVTLGSDNIDVVNLNKVPIQLRYRAVTEGKLIYEADYIATSNFLEETYKLYLDFAYGLNVFYRERSKVLREAYANGG